MRFVVSTILYAACTFRPYKSTPVLKLFRTFTGKMTRGLSLRMVFSLLFQDTLLSVDGICHQTDSMNRFYLNVKTGPKISRKYLKHKNAHGDCDAAMIAKAAAAVTHVQSLSQEVGSGDEGLGLFGFDLSSAETDF